MTPQPNTEPTFNEYMAAFAEQMRANRRANDFLECCTDLYEQRSATQLVWLVDDAVRTYMPELLGTPYTESEVWPHLREQVLDDLKRVDLQAWSVRNSCPVEHLADEHFEFADHVIITEPVNWGELPEFEQYKLPTLNPWVFVGLVPETGYTQTRPSWWDHPRQYWKQTRRWHNGRPVYEPAVSVRPPYDAPVSEIRVDVRRLGLPLEVRKTNTEGLFELVWDRSVELPAVLKSPQTLERERRRARFERLMGGDDK